MGAQAVSDSTDMVSQIDIILPTQYFGALGSVGLSSEQRLMLAVLADAVNVLQSTRIGNGRKRQAFAEAAQWVNTTGTNYPFSFDSVCDALDIDPEVLRSRLRWLTLGLAARVRKSVIKLRLKELSRSQHMTTNRVRRREQSRIVIRA
jgi:hypothetical protein